MTAGPVGLLAGHGRLPEVLARAVRAQGRRVVCVQMAGASPALEGLTDVFVRLRPTQWADLLALWQQHGVHEVLVAGRFRRTDLLVDLAASDETVRGFLAQLPDRRDQNVLLAFAGLLELLGMHVVDQLAYIGDHVPEPGLLAGPPLAPEEKRDVTEGLALGRTLAGMDVGQTVVLKHGVILAVEAAEGTDAAIRRGGEMVRGAVVVKVSRPQQDPRFDIPTVGPETVEAMAQVGARVLAVEARRTIVLDGARLRAAAEAGGISVLALDAPPLQRAQEQT